MRPELLLLGSGWVPDVDALLERSFVCHRLAGVAQDERDAFIARIGVKVRGVDTTGIVGLDAATAARLPRLEIVAVHGVGVDAVDFDALAPRAIPVTNTPDVLSNDVADLAVGLLLAASRRLPQLDRYVRAGAWEAKSPLTPARSLRGKVAGIVGFGRIGQAVAARLQAFGIAIRYFQRSTAPGPYPRSESLLALVLALREGRLGAAALDVFEDEPRVPPSLRELDNVVLTPHVGSFTIETRTAMGMLAANNLLAHFDGKP